MSMRNERLLILFLLASLSENAYREGDLNGALEYALQALPSKENPRPYVPAAELALSGELNIYRQGLLSYARSFTQDSAVLRMAVSPDGIPEALYRPKSRFLWAVQWHPEFSYQKDENSRKIFRAFVRSMV